MGMKSSAEVRVREAKFNIGASASDEVSLTVEPLNVFQHNGKSYLVFASDDAARLDWAEMRCLKDGTTELKIKGASALISFLIPGRKLRINGTMDAGAFDSVSITVLS